MTNLVKHESSIETAINAALTQQQWASKMPEAELNAFVLELCHDYADIMGVKKANVDDKVLNAAIVTLREAIKADFKGLHKDEIRRAIIRDAGHAEDEVKMFSAHRMIRALQRYQKEDRMRLFKQGQKKRLEQPERKRLTVQEMEEALQSFYLQWKSKGGDVLGKTVFYGYAKKCGKIKLTEDDFVRLIMANKDKAIEELKSVHFGDRSAWNKAKDDRDYIEAITEDHIRNPKIHLKLPNNLRALCECQALDEYFEKL